MCLGCKMNYCINRMLLKEISQRRIVCYIDLFELGTTTSVCYQRFKLREIIAKTGVSEFVEYDDADFRSVREGPADEIRTAPIRR